MHDFTHRPEKVRDVMTGPDVETVQDTTPIESATVLMRSRRIRHLPVLRNDQLAGLLSERDVLRHLVVRGTQAGKRDPVSAAMSAQPATVTPDDPLAWAAGLMAERRIGCLPVVEEGHLRGIVTLTDLVRHQGEEAFERPSVQQLPLAKTVMRPNAVVATPETTVLDALATMTSRRIRHLPVVGSAGRVVGMITDRDVRTLAGDPRRAILDGTIAERIGTTPLSEVMSQPAVTVTDDMPLFMVAETLARKRVGAVPVIAADGKLVGIISAIDAIQALL